MTKSKSTATRADDLDDAILGLDPSDLAEVVQPNRPIRRAMVDLETFGLGAAPAIASIGLVIWEIDRGAIRVVLKAHMGVDVTSCLLAGLDVDQDTVRWWRNQSAEARRELSDLEKMPLWSVLHQLGGIWTEYVPEEIWANGPASDVVWLESAYRAVGLPVPWGFRDVRCCRTTIALAQLSGWERPEQSPSLVAHSALDDALGQVNEISEAIVRLSSSR